MKLYEIPNNSTIQVIGGVQTPPNAANISEGDILDFHHIDGMYSLCVNSKGEIVHLNAWAEVEILKD